jgi:hypothetical protein
MRPADERRDADVPFRVHRDQRTFRINKAILLLNVALLTALALSVLAPPTFAPFALTTH